MVHNSCPNDFCLFKWCMWDSRFLSSCCVHWHRKFTARSSIEITWSGGRQFFLWRNGNDSKQPYYTSINNNNTIINHNWRSRFHTSINCLPVFLWQLNTDTRQQTIKFTCILRIIDFCYGTQWLSINLHMEI
jgi:hypothetical protein